MAAPKINSSSEDESSAEDLSDSCSEYVPETSSCDSGDDIIIPIVKPSEKALAPIKTHSDETCSTLEGSAVLRSPTSYKSTKDVAELKMKVIGVSNTYKQNFCYYCSKCVTRISRHLRTHSSEREMVEILSMSHQKQVYYLKALKLKGNYRHNIDCIAKGEGNLIVMRSPKLECSAQDFLPCLYCYGFLAKRELTKHCKVCHYRPKTFIEESPVKSGKLMLLQYVKGEGSNELREKVLVNLREGAVKEKILGDPLILCLGNNLICKLRSSKGEKFRYISNRLRNLGRLLLEVEKVQGSSNSLEDILMPGNFDVVVHCVKRMCMKKNQPKSLGLKIGYDLRKASIVAKCNAIKNGNEVKRQEFDDFLVLMNSEWSDMISSSLLRELYDRKLDRDNILPLTSDLVELTKFINEGLLNSLNALLDFKSAENYFQLAKLTLCKIITFNKRRGGEVARISVSDFSTRSKWKSKRNEDIYNSLSDLEKKLIDKLELIKVSGKRGRHVPILLTPEVVKSMEVLVRERDNVGIKKSNQFFFANHGENYLRSHDVLNEILAKTKLSNAGVITSTNLRKYVATVTQIVSLEKEELEWVADHLGHSIEVHREFYRLQEDVLEMSKVSKLLLTIENGNVHQIAGKKLSDITLEHCFKGDVESDGNIEHDKSNAIELEDNKIVELREDDQIEELESMTPCKLRKIDSRKGGQKSRNTSRAASFVKQKRGQNCSGYESIKANRKKVWDLAVKEKVKKHFRLFIESRKTPRKRECLKFMEQCDMKDRTWKDLKYLVYNCMKK